MESSKKTTCSRLRLIGALCFTEISNLQTVKPSVSDDIGLGCPLNFVTVVILDTETDGSTYKLCDLGIAKIWDPTAKQTKRGRGTTAYMPKVATLHGRD